jgi:hypothetical protein
MTATTKFDERHLKFCELFVVKGSFMRLKTAHMPLTSPLYVPRNFTYHRV